MPAPIRLEKEIEPQKPPYSDIHVSVVIPTRNGSREMQRTLRSLLSGSRSPDEIVVLDQSDDDATKREVEAVQSHPKGNRIRYVASTRPGLCAHRNDAFREATGDFIASVDDDVAVAKDWLESMIHEWVSIWRKAPVLITGRILPPADAAPGALISALRLSKERIVYLRKPRFSDALIGAHFGASRELFTVLGDPPFDERLGLGTQFPGGDDDEFAYRVLKAGFPIVYEPSIMAVHNAKAVLSWRRMRFSYAIGSGAAMAKHLLQGDIGVVYHLGRSFMANLGKSLKSLVLLQEPEGTARLLATAGVVIGLFGWVFAGVTGRLKR